MRRAEPPSFATWILKRLSPSDRDETHALQPDAIAIAFKDPEEWSAKRFVATMMFLGLMNAFIAALLFCRLPASSHPTAGTLFVRAVIYVVITAVAGIAGTRFYWSDPTGSLASALPVSFPLFALIGASAWVWLPAATLFSTQDSPATALIVGTGTALLASGLRRVIPAPATPGAGEQELFAETLRAPVRSADGYIIAVGIYLALLAFATHQDLNAGVPLAVCSGLLGWRLTLAPSEATNGRPQLIDAAKRVGWTAAVAVFVTLLALMFGVERRARLEAQAGQNTSGNSIASSSQPIKKTHSRTLGGAGYESIILWPVPDKKQILAPLSGRLDLLPPGSKRPVILHFTGSYWYFQPPNTGPGLRAHQANATPLALNIRSSNGLPVAMEAHQRLAGEIRLARCREIQIAIADHDQNAGALAVAVLLSDSALHGGPALYLGQLPLTGATLQDDVLSFAVPEHAKIHKFDEIAVTFLRDPLHSLTGPRVAIEQFELIPR